MPSPSPRPSPPPPPPPRPAGPAQPPRPVGPRLPLRFAFTLIVAGVYLIAVHSSDLTHGWVLGVFCAALPVKEWRRAAHDSPARPALAEAAG